MAEKTIFTYEYTCDLCGETRDKDDLVHVFDKARGVNEVQQSRSHAGPQVDICPECQKRPISALIEWCGSRTPR